MGASIAVQTERMKIWVSIWFLKIAFICVLLVILTAGLWPFHTPANDVSWLRDGNGLFFGKHGSIVSASPVEVTRSPPNKSCSLEIWLKPNRIDAGGVGMILAFYSPPGKLVPFSMRQFHDGLVLGHEDRDNSAKMAEIYIGGVFRGVGPAFVTIVSSESGTDTYLDGTLLKRVPSFRLSSRDLTGQLLVGGAPSTSYNWSGELKGLAIYDHALSPTEVSQRFAAWRSGSQPVDAKSEGVVARYVFDERAGRIVRNQVDSTINLLIPEHFFILDQKFLETPWDEYLPNLSYWKDIVVNIVGFVPLGFFFYAYLSLIWKMKWATWLTIVLGFAVSLTIEVLQAFLPTRDSGMTDLITNTLGTAIGVLLCSWVIKSKWFAQRAALV